MKNKVLLIGLDGATFDIIEVLARRGELPVFDRIIQRGVHCNLESTIPPATCQAWTSMVTGKNPAKHGIFDFTAKIDIEKKEMSFVNSSFRKSEAVWNLLDKNGRKSMIINVPVTYPPEPVNGIMISGMFTPSTGSSFTYPREIKKELVQRGYIIDVGGASYLTLYKHDKEALIKKITHMTKKRTEATLFLMKTFDWDFLMIVFVGLDRLHHLFWKSIDPKYEKVCSQRILNYRPLVVEYYKELESIIKSLLNVAGTNATTIIASDHGFRSLENLFFTNTFLAKKQFIKLKRLRWSRKFGLTQRCLLNLTASLQLEPLVESIPKWLIRKFESKIPSSFQNIFDIDVRSTKAYQCMYGGIKINLKGRDSGGIVDRGEEYSQVREEIISLLEKERDPKTGRRIFHHVYKKEDIYSGPYLEDAPDLILMPNPPYRAGIKLAPKIIMPVSPKADTPSLVWSGEHDPQGIFLMIGPNIKRGAKISDAKIVDVVPTVCRLLDCPVPPDVDGVVLDESFEQ